MKIPLHAGHWSDPGPVIAWAEVDPEDYGEIAQYRWHLNGDGYAIRTSHRDIPAVCPECGWLPKQGLHWARSMANHRAKKHAKHSEGARYTIFMHRQILALEHGDPRQGDHENRNRLDNQRSNLRITPGPRQVQNQGSTKTYKGNAVESDYRGVYKVKKRGKWNGRWKAVVAQYYLGCFDSEEAAAEAAAAYRRETMPFALD